MSVPASATCAASSITGPRSDVAPAGPRPCRSRDEDPVTMSAHPTIAGFGYHEITDDPSASGFQRPGARPYTLTPRAFAAHLDQMAASEARPMRVTDIDFTRSGRCLVLTFDDGGKSAVHAGDALARRGWTGHFFIVSSLIGTRTFATASDIRYLASCGHVVGTHTHTHPDIFPDLTPERMLEEWRTSGDAISERSEEHTSELQSLAYLVCRLLLEKKKKKHKDEVNV